MRSMRASRTATFHVTVLCLVPRALAMAALNHMHINPNKDTLITNMIFVPKLTEITTS